MFSRPEHAGFLPVAQLGSLVARLMALGYQCMGPAVEQGAIVMRELEADDGVRCIVLRGAGDKAFAAGADISEFEKVRANARVPLTLSKPPAKDPAAALAL